MINTSLLSEEEYKKICNAIPHKLVTMYFQNNPKDFSRLFPGFRPSAVQKKDAVRLLITYRDKGFISSFVEHFIHKSIEDILSCVKNYQSEGESELASYIHSLYRSFFAENTSAFFKLIEKEYDKEQLETIANLVSLLKELDDKQRTMKTTCDEIKESLRISETKEKNVKKALEKSKKQISDLIEQRKELRNLQIKMQQLSIDNEKIREEKDSLDKQINELNQKNADLNGQIGDLQNEKKEFEKTIRNRIDEEKEVLPTIVSVPLVPIDIKEFLEFLSENFNCIGIHNVPLPINNLLSSYVSNIVFQGKPIICNKCIIHSFTKCISNSLTGNAPINILSFSPAIEEKKIHTFIQNSGRIVVLDNFLGNYNETYLLSLLEKYKSKMIFLSVAYEKTLSFLSKEMLNYCNYINLSSIPSIMRSISPDEDPAVVEEKELSNIGEYVENRYKKILTSIMNELDYPQMLSTIVSEHVNDDLSVCGVLLFNVLPYLRDVYSKNAFNYSETLQRYVGRSSYKKVFEEWFAK